MDISNPMEAQSPVEQNEAGQDVISLLIEDCGLERKTPQKDSSDSGISGLRVQQVNNNTFVRHPTADSACVPTTYRKGTFLGKGGFAHVHELIDQSTNIIYAGKIIPKHRISKPYHAEKIAREITIHRKLLHKNVVRLHHFFEDKLNAYIILENCSQKSLLHVLRHREMLTEPEARYYLYQLVEGVCYIHSQKVIHRDLKPGNMFLNENMIVKIGDFGLATLDNGSNKVSICGTPNYMAPEILKKLCPSYEADVWAIGCILYALLVGQPPFETDTIKGTYARIVTNKYTIPLKISIPAQNLIRQILQPLPENRLTLDKIMNHEFFKCGFMPESLSLVYCYIAPTFGKPFNRCKFSRSILQPYNENRSHNIPKITTQRNTLLMKTSFKQKLTNVLCPEKTGRIRKESNAINLYKKLACCLQHMPVQSGDSPNLPLAVYTPLFVMKWIDYSNKYGFGFQLSDQSVGVLFNDNVSLLFNPDKSWVEYHDKFGKINSYFTENVPPFLNGMLTLLKYFAQYMDEHLTVGGGVGNQLGITYAASAHMKRWFRSNLAIIMELSNGTMQVNFFNDHTKIVISPHKGSVLVTYINHERQNSSYWLQDIQDKGCDTRVRDCLRFATAVLRDFAEMDKV